jgi:hypothetical protein
VHVESWLLRAALLATAVYQIAFNANPSGAVVAVQGFVVALIPVAVTRLSKTHVPRLLELAFTAAMALQYLSESVKLFEYFTYWDKVVHPLLVALTALIAGWLVLGYAHAYGKRISIHFGAAFGLLIGTSLGAFWEFVELGSDWFGGANLQKSNADTMTDIIANDIGAFVATLLGMFLFVHVLNDHQRREMGQIARWLAHGPGLVLQRHGRLVGACAASVFAAVMLAAQWVDRDEPALASGLVPGQDVSIAFAASPPPDASQILSGDWIPDARGVCRVNLEKPRPGSEKPGILQLAPGSVYGDRPFSVEVRYFEQRPEQGEGTEMNGGIAFGIRNAGDYDLLEQSALHDVLRVDHFLHNRRRDLREKLFRTHGNEWHTLRVDVDGSNVTASVDGEAVFTATNVPATAGGVGLWARATAATCFSDASITVGGSTR